MSIEKTRLIDRVVNPGIRRIAKAEIKRHKARTSLVLLLIFIPSLFSLRLSGSFGGGLNVDDNSMGLRASNAQAALELLDNVKPVRSETWVQSTASSYLLSEQPILHGLSNGEIRDRPKGVNQDYVLIEGAVPESAGEIAVDVKAAQLYRLDIGDTLRVRNQQRAVVGIARGIGFSEAAVFVPQGTLDSGSVVGNVWFRDANRVQEIHGLHPSVEHAKPTDSAQLNYSFHGVPRGTSLLVAAASMALAATVCAAAWTVGFQRRLRQVALANIVGAEPRHLRRSVVLQAAWISCAAFGAAWACAVLWAWYFKDFGSVFTVGNDYPSLALVLGNASIIVGLSLIAAWLPIRSLRLESVTSGLAGRTSQHGGSFRMFAEGVAAICSGLLVLKWATNRDTLLAASVGFLGVGVIFGGAGLVLPWLIDSSVVRLRNLSGRWAAGFRFGLNGYRQNRQRSVAMTLFVGSVVVIGMVVLLDLEQSSPERGISLEGLAYAFGVPTLILILLGLARRSEDGDERSALYALGAEPRLFRTTAFWNGFATGAMAIVVAMPIGVAIYTAATIHYRRFAIPWFECAVLALIVPLLVAAVGAVVTPGPRRSKQQWVDRQLSAEAGL